MKLADKLYNLLDLERSLPLGNWFYHLLMFIYKMEMCMYNIQLLLSSLPGFCKQQLSVIFSGTARELCCPSNLGDSSFTLFLFFVYFLWGGGGGGGLIYY